MRVGHQDVAEPDQERVDHSDQEQTHEPPLEEPARISPSHLRAIHEDGESHPEQQRKQRVKLPFDQEAHEKHHFVVPGGERQRGACLRRDEAPPGEAFDVHEQNAQHRHATNRVEDVHAFPGHGHDLRNRRGEGHARILFR